MEGDVIKTYNSKSFEGMFDLKFLHINFTKLESFYQKRLNHDDLDERFFIRDRKPFTPGKFTPFARQGAANKVSINLNPSRISEQPQPAKKSGTSSRVLNYEVSEKVSMRTNLSEIVI